MAASAVCRAACSGTRVLLRTRRTVRWRRGRWPAQGLRASARRWGAGCQPWRAGAGRSRGRGRGKVTAEGGEGTLGWLGRESRNPAVWGWESGSYRARLLPAAGPAEAPCLAGRRHLRPGPPERAGDPGQRAGQRAACGLGAVLPSHLHGECRPRPQAARPPWFPGWAVTLGSSCLCFGWRLASCRV